MPVRWAIANGNFSTGSTWNDGAILGIPTGSDDIWTNTFTVNVDQSFNALTLNNTARARDISSPLMTSNTNPIPFVASSSNSAIQAFQAFNRTANTAWSYSTLPSWVSIDYGSGSLVIIDSYMIETANVQSNNPQAWQFQGSNDFTLWTTLHSVSLGAAIAANGTYTTSSINNSTPYRYYRLNVTANGGGASPNVADLYLYERFTGTITAGGSFNFNSGSISGSVTSTSPLSAGATNLITVTATTGSVGLTLGGAVTARSVASDIVINHSGNCNFNLSGTTFNGGNNTNSNCIIKSSLGTITVTGSLVGGGGTSAHGLNSTAGNTIILGNSTGFGGTGITQTVGNINITGNVSSVGGSVVAANGINFGGTLLTINGNVVAGSTAAAITSTGTISVIGNITGSAAIGITTTAPVIVSGSVIAQGAAAAISAGANVVFINVSGSVIASATANAISATNASAVVNLAGNIVNVNGKQAIYCQNLFLDNTATTQARFFTFGGSDRTLYSSDTFPNLPSASNVRFGTSYGPGSGNTGTLRMASPQDVRSGVLTDNTTGSAILSAQSLFNEISSSSDPFAQRLRNISTVDTVGYLLTSFKK